MAFQTSIRKNARILFQSANSRRDVRVKSIAPRKLALLYLKSKANHAFRKIVRFFYCKPK